MDEARLDQVSEFKLLERVLDESGKDVAERCRRVASGRKIPGAIKSLVNTRVYSLGLRGGYVPVLL